MALVFLSYCREADSALAHLLETELNARGDRAFLDVKILPGGKFNEPLLMILEQADAVAVILSPQAVQRNSEYQALEVAAAMKAGKRIVPVVTPNFDWEAAKQVAPWVGEIQQFNAVVTSFDYRDAFIERLVRFTRPPIRPQEALKGLRLPGSLRRMLLGKPWWQFWR